MTHRDIRKLAVAIQGPRRSPEVTVHTGVIVSVSGSTASIWLDGDTEPRDDPDSPNPIPGVPITPGLVVAVDQAVEVTFLGAAPSITRRLT